MVSFPVIPVFAAVAVCCMLFYHYILYPAFLSPLAKIPNAHPTASISPLWMLIKRFYGKENMTIHAAHEKFGPIVKLGPTEVSVNSYEGGLRTIYAGGFEKHHFYANLFMNYEGVTNMFAMSYSKPHSIRKRMMSNVYSKTYLLSSPTMEALSSIIIHKRLLPKLQRLAASPPGGIEVHALFNQITMDFITAYQFGLNNSTNFIEDDRIASWWNRAFHDRRYWMFWSQEMPQVPAFLARIGIRMIPAWVDGANTKLDDYCMEMCDAASKSTVEAEENNPENVPIVYRQLATVISNDPTAKSDPASTRLLVASEMLDHLAAGQETSAITLTYLFHELSLHPTLQSSLRAELASLSQTFTAPPLPPPKDINALPLLNAILQETLRLHTAIPGPEPRVTPAQGAVLGPPGHEYLVPGNVRVSSQPYTLHRLPEVFPRAEEFRPERWLPGVVEGAGEEGKMRDEERLKEMYRHFWAFSSGGRMCIGSHFAIQEIKLVVAAIISQYRVFPVDGGHEGIEQEDAYTAHPISGKLVLRFEKI